MFEALKRHVSPKSPKTRDTTMPLALLTLSSLPLYRQHHTVKFCSIRCSSQTSTHHNPNPMSDSDPPPPKRHVVVCGGGVIGVCTAFFLSKRGDAEVTLIERSSIAAAASGKAGGFLALDWCDSGPLSSLARTSFDLHRSLAEELNGGESYGYRRLSTLSLSVTETTSWDNRRSGRNVPAWVDGPAKEVRSIGTTETTAQVHPGMFCRTLAEKAKVDYAFKVVTGKVEGVVVGGGGTSVKGVVLEGGEEIEADSVVLALGPWSGKLNMLASIFRVYGLKAHSIVLEPSDKDSITDHALFLSYYPADGGGRPMDPEVYPRPSGEVYICGMSGEAEVPDDPEQIFPVAESIGVLKRVARTVSSHLCEEKATVKAEQACFLPCTDDSVPIIGEVPGVKGCFVATGHSCWGILNGPATGLAVSELVMDGASTIVDLSPFSPCRFLGARKY